MHVSGAVRGSSPARRITDAPDRALCGAEFDSDLRERDLLGCHFPHGSHLLGEAEV
jgi:hypothetical protein